MSVFVNRLSGGRRHDRLDFARREARARVTAEGVTGAGGGARSPLAGRPIGSGRPWMPRCPARCAIRPFSENDLPALHPRRPDCLRRPESSPEVLARMDSQQTAELCAGVDPTRVDSRSY